MNDVFLSQAELNEEGTVFFIFSQLLMGLSGETAGRIPYSLRYNYKCNTVEGRGDHRSKSGLVGVIQPAGSIVPLHYSQ